MAKGLKNPQIELFLFYFYFFAEYFDTRANGIFVLYNKTLGSLQSCVIPALFYVDNVFMLPVGFSEWKITNGHPILTILFKNVLIIRG